MERAAPRHERENWADEAYVADWLVRQESRAAERQRQFAMVYALVPRAADEGFRLLDIGAGDGSLTEMLLQRFPRAEATLVDGSPGMVERARGRLQPFGSRAAVVVSDLATPAWAASVAAPFDVAVSTIAIHNLEDPLRIRVLYGEVFQLMSDGGFFMNLDYMRAAQPALGSFYRWASAAAEAGFAPVRGYRDYAGTVMEHLGWLQEAGFGAAECFWKELRLAVVGGFKGSVRAPEGPR